MDEINRLTYDTKSVLKKTKKKLRYFAIMAGKDKIMMTSIYLILFVIVVIVVLSMTGNDDGNFKGVPKDLITSRTGW